MWLGYNPFQRSVFWDESENNLVHFKYPLPSGTKKEDVKVEIDEDGNGKLLIEISKGLSSHSDPLSSASSSMTRFGSSFLSFAKKNEGDTASPIMSMKVNLPAGLDPNGFKTAIDDEGLLTLTFKKFVPIHSERPFDLKNDSEWVTAKENNKDVVHFKANLAAGTKMGDVMVGIAGGNSLMIGLLKKEEGDTNILKRFHGNNCWISVLPDGANPDGFKAAMDDAGVLTVTFTKLKPEKKKLMPSPKKILGYLSEVVPACLLIGCRIGDEMSSGDY